MGQERFKRAKTDALGMEVQNELCLRNSFQSRINRKTKKPRVLYEITFVGIKEIFEEIIEEKKKGVSITKALQEREIPKTSFYSAINEYGLEKWRDLTKGKLYVRRDKERQKETN